MQRRHAKQSFYGMIFNEGLQGTNFNAAELLPTRSLATTGAGESARQAASFQFVGMLAWMGGSCACPLAETLAGATCRIRNTGGTDATGTAEEGSGG